MDDFQIVVYILLVVLYIISRALKAKKKVVPPPDSQHSEFGKPESGQIGDVPNPYQIPDKLPPVTFEDLLKEFTGAKEEPQNLPDSIPTIKEIKKDRYENPYVPVVKPAYEQKTYPTYKFSEPEEPSEHFSYDDMYKGPEKLVLTDTDKIDINKGRFGAYYSEKTYDVHNSAHFRKLLHDPISLKDAIILKEILDRKYF